MTKLDYIDPTLNEYENVDVLLGNKKETFFYNKYSRLSKKDLIEKEFLCILGEPGVGKTRLLNELRKLLNKREAYFINAVDFNPQSVPSNIKICLIDALDEVRGDDFYNKLISIKEYKENNDNVKVIFSCRKSYVGSYVAYFSFIKHISYVEIDKLGDEDVKILIQQKCKLELDSIVGNGKLLSLFSIPRYLIYLLEYGNEKKVLLNLCDLFEYIIDRSIDETLKNYNINANKSNLAIVIKRVLERVAFIMEISRKDQILKDELYSILDGIKGNMASILISNVDLFFFQNRIMKESNEKLLFENTQLQEFLAAKELYRQDNIESVIYEVAVHEGLGHIYPNWFDVIAHISYMNEKSDFFINLLKQIIFYDKNLSIYLLETLLRFINPLSLSSKQRDELFPILLNYFLTQNVYFGSNSFISEFLINCFTPVNYNKLDLDISNYNSLQIENICAIIKPIVENNWNDIDRAFLDYWGRAAEKLIQENDVISQLRALNILDAVNDNKRLIDLATKFQEFPPKVKEKYCKVTGYKKIEDKEVINCWLSSFYENNPFAIKAILSIKDYSLITYVYGHIINKNNLEAFFKPSAKVHVDYDSNLKDQFKIAWRHGVNDKILITKVLQKYVETKEFHHSLSFYPMIKKILLNSKTGYIFMNSFSDKWGLVCLLDNFDAEYIDDNLLKILEKLLTIIFEKKCVIDRILSNLRNKVCSYKNKTVEMSTYQGNSPKNKQSHPQEKEREIGEDEFIQQEFQLFSNPVISIHEKVRYAYKLCLNFDDLPIKDSKPLINVICSFMDTIDLEKLLLTANSNSGFQISFGLAAIPHFVRALYTLQEQNNLIKYRDIIIKDLPIACCTVAGKNNEIKTIYKDIIGNISESEKKEYVKWWKSRMDDFLNVRPDEVIYCIKEYELDALSYKLEDYIKQYVDNQIPDFENNAYKSLELISQGYLNWKKKNYESLFEKLQQDNINSVKVLCNSILIEQFEDINAIEWRINYLEIHVCETTNHESIHRVSEEEYELQEQNSRMFRCFMGIRNNKDLEDKMIDLFDFALTLFNSSNTFAYAKYLLQNIYQFFVNNQNEYYIEELRSKIGQSEVRGNTEVNGIMKRYEKLFMSGEKLSILEAIKIYNKCIEESHLPIRNSGDMRRFFTDIRTEVDKEIQDVGEYSLIHNNRLNEDYMQRVLKSIIMKVCYRLGLKNIQIVRENALQDNKRPDILIRYGFCRPIMIELKLLNNKEIQNPEKRKQYKLKFQKYIEATQACLAVYWVFGEDEFDENYVDLKREYADIKNIQILYTSCKCSSGVNTGIKKRRTKK